MKRHPILKVFQLRRGAVRWLVAHIGPSPLPGGVSRGRLHSWVARYGFAEVAGIVCAFLGSLLAGRATGSRIAAAYGAAWGETLGYASVIVIHDFLQESRAAHAAAERFGARRATGVVGGLLAEFGPAALLDTFVTRPLAMGLAIHWLGNVVGIIAGKIVADVLFYVPVILVHERRTRARRS